MDSTCRGSVPFVVFPAAALGAVVAVPLAVLMAAAFYLGTAVSAVAALGRMLGAVPETFPPHALPGPIRHRQEGGPSAPPAASDRLAS